jgi:Rhodopirellula transposase DDE domain
MTTTQKQIVTQTISGKYEMLMNAGALNERTRRIWAATEACSLGHGGVSIVVSAIGIDFKTVRSGLYELDHPETGAAHGRIRRSGGGRHKLTDIDKTLLDDLNKLIDPDTRGDPESPLRWTSKSTVNISQALRTISHTISSVTVGKILKDSGYSLQANRKTSEGKNHPDRDTQFRFINDAVTDFQAHQQPVISVDTKKKELVGSFKNNGLEWEKSKQPVEVNMHDFPDKELGKVAPYGVYDVTKNEGWVSVGVTKDTAEFAVQSIRTWWNELGKQRYPNAAELLITADCGGSNGRRVRLWKQQLQCLADETGLAIHVRHFPPGTSKWNKIEHRLFSFVTKNWRGKPLIDRATIINLIGNTTTKAGLKVYATLDERVYEKGIKVSDKDMKELNHIPEDWHGEWNYRIEPRKK